MFMVFNTYIWNLSPEAPLPEISSCNIIYSHNNNIREKYTLHFVIYFYLNPYLTH